MNESALYYIIAYAIIAHAIYQWQNVIWAKTVRINKMNKRNQLICAHSGLVFAVLLGAGWFFIPGWFPPIEPGLNAEAIQAMYSADRQYIRIGISLCVFSGVFFWSLSAAIAGQMRRIEGYEDPILSRVQMASASGAVLTVLFTGYFVLAAAYRPDMSAQNIQIFNDLAWLMFIGAYPPLAIQVVAIGLCILGDKSDKTLFPRWLGFVNFWVAVLFLPGVLLPFFHSGPFAWNGLIGFWLVAFFFFLWIGIIWRYTVKAIQNQDYTRVAT